MCIILRLVCETFSRIAVKISFLCGPQHGIYRATSFSANVTSWCSRDNTQNFSSAILYMNIIFIAQWLSGGNSCYSKHIIQEQNCFIKVHTENKTHYINSIQNQNFFENSWNLTLSRCFCMPPETLLARKYFQAKMCQLFLPRKYVVISQLRHSYARVLFAWRSSYDSFQSQCTRKHILLYLHVRVQCTMNLRSSVLWSSYNSVERKGKL